MAKASDLDIQTLINGARAAGAGRRSGLTDDQTIELAELQSELKDLEATRVELTDRRDAGEAIDTQLLIEIRNRQKLVRRQVNRIEQRAARSFNQQRQLSPEDRSQLEAAGIDPDRFIESQADELRALGINPDDPRLGQFNDNRQAYPGERGGFDRDAEFLRQAAQGFDGADDANLLQNFGGLGDNNEVRDADRYFEEMQNAQNERGPTPNDQQRQRRQGPALLPPGEGAGRRPGSLVEFVEGRVNEDTVASPDGIRNSEKHQQEIRDQRNALARRIENEYGINFGTTDERRVRNRQFDQASLDLLGEEWKQQDFGGGRAVGDGVARQLIDTEGKARRKAGLKRDEDGNVITKVGRDGKERKIRVNRGYARAPQEVGNSVGATQDAVRRIESQLAFGELSLTTPIEPSAPGRRARTVEDLLQDLKGNADGSVGLESERREAKKARGVADRRARGEYSATELREGRRKIANNILFPGMAPKVEPLRGTPVFDQSELRTGSRQTLDPELLEMQRQLNLVDGSTPSGRQLQELMLRDMRQRIVMGRVGKAGQPVLPNPNNDAFLGGSRLQVGTDPRFPQRGDAVNPFFNEDRFNAPFERAVVPMANDTDTRRSVDALVEEAIGAEAAKRAEVGPGRQRWVQAQNEFVARQLPEMMANEAIRVAGERRGSPLTPVEERVFRDNLQQEILPGQQIKGIDVSKRFSRQLNRGENQTTLTDFEAALDLRPEITRGQAEPVIVDGQLIGYADPVEQQLLGETDPSKMMAFDEQQGRFVQPAAVRDGNPLAHARNWIDMNLFDEFDERQMGDQVDANWPRNQQIVQPLAALDEAVAKKVKHPVRIRSVEDFNNAIDEFIAIKQDSSRPFFDLPDEANPGSNKRVPISQIPDDQLFDAALKDLKVPQKPLARALNVLDEAAGNMSPGSMQVVNAVDKAAFAEGVGTPIGSNEKVRSLDLDATIQTIGGARLKQPQRNTQGVLIEDEGRHIAPML